MIQPLKTTEAPNEAEKIDWLRLSRTENIGPITFYRLLETYGSAAKALDALPELSRRGGRKKPLSAAPRVHIEDEYAAIQKLGGDIVIAAEQDYPLALSAIDDAPPVLSYFGNPKIMGQSCIGLVGARSASLNGRKFAFHLAGELGRQNQIIVSGLARGIDTAAHEGALETGTIAVVAGGLDVVYPEENKALFGVIAEKGLVIAESPLGTAPKAQHFPRRNRLVSGLSKAVIVIEATMRSGSLITARLAGEQGRDVMAVPGHPLDPRAQGPNHLIREGATLVRNAADVLEIIRDFSGTGLREPVYPQSVYAGPVMSEENLPDNARARVLENLSFTPITVDELLRACDLSIPALQTILLELEIAGRIKREPGGRISLLETGY